MRLDSTRHSKSLISLEANVARVVSCTGTGTGHRHGQTRVRTPAKTGTVFGGPRITGHLGSRLQNQPLYSRPTQSEPCQSSIGSTLCANKATSALQISEYQRLFERLVPLTAHSGATCQCKSGCVVKMTTVQSPLCTGIGTPQVMPLPANSAAESSPLQHTLMR